MKVHDLGGVCTLSGPHYGLEIEVENCHDIPASEHRWTHCGDGSLRMAGVEFLTVGAVNPEELLDHVHEWYQWYERYNWETSIRTSTHVHVNMSDRELAEVHAALGVYVLCEPLLYRYCGPMREQNIYCVPYYRAPRELDWASHLRNDNRGCGAALAQTCKYSGLYLEPLVRFGTLEFRQAPVFDHAEQLLIWIDLVTCVTHSRFRTINEVAEKWDRDGPDEFYRTVFGDRLLMILQGLCDYDFDELADLYDVEGSLERLMPWAEDVKEWVTPPQLLVEGDGTAMYYSHTAGYRQAYIPNPIRWDDHDEEPEYEPDEYYDEEDF